MKTSRLDIDKLLEILTDMKAKGHKYVILELTENSDSHVITIHPVDVKKIGPSSTPLSIQDIIDLL